ncbi:MAG: solute carrier family 23 protein [Cyanobacteriota bacterium]
MSNLVYNLEDKPKTLKETLAISIQHVLSMFSGTVAVPLLLAPVMGMNVEETGLLVSLVLLTSGIATFVQVFWGSRLPIIQGASFVFLGTFLSIIYFVKTTGTDHSPQLMMQYIMGAVILGGIVEMVIGYSGLVGKLKKYLTPIVIGPVIFLIGISIFEFGAPKAGLYWPISLLVISLIIFFSQILGQKKFVYRIYSILLGIGSGYLICLLLTYLNIFESGHPCYISFEQVETAPWVQNPVSLLFPWGLPKFSLVFLISILVGYAISIVESIGDYHSCSYMCEQGDPEPQIISNGIGAEGLGCVITGIFGAFSNTSYTQNVALIGLTKVASRYIAVVSGLILVLLGLFSKIGILIASIPEPIIGATYCVLFAMIAGLGISQIKKVDLNKDRNVFIIGFSIFMGLSLTAYFKGVHTETSLANPEEFLGWNYLPSPLIWEYNQQIADIVNSIGKNSMAVAAIISLLLDNIIPGKDLPAD